MSESESEMFDPHEPSGKVAKNFQFGTYSIISSSPLDVLAYMHSAWSWRTFKLFWNVLKNLSISFLSELFISVTVVILRS